MATHAPLREEGPQDCGTPESAPPLSPSVRALLRPGLEPAIRSSKERLRLRLYAILFLADIVCLFAGFLLANQIRFGTTDDGPGLGLALACAPVYAALAFSGRSYALEALAAPRRSIRNSLRALAMTGFGILGVLYSVKGAGDISRLVFLTGIAGSAGFIAALRYTIGHSAGRRHGWNFVNEVILVDGVPVFPARGQIVLFADTLRLSPSINDPESFDRMGRCLANCDRVILASHPSRRAAWAAVLKCAGIAVELLTPELDALGPLQLRQFEGKAAVLVATGPLGVRDRLAKRALDLFLAATAILLLWPVIAITALAVRLTSPGPVFFQQERVGQANRIFTVLKFRTMRAGSGDQAGSVSARRGDARLTAIGGFLRRTSLDELPQLFNVLLGDMSLVGPRPHALGSTAGEALFWHADERYWERGMVKPGITGLAQIRGLRGATETREDLVNRVQADLEYLADWTIWRDFAILARTAKVLVHRNAF